MKILGIKQIVIISSIIFLNATGVSYACWTDRLQIKTTLETGKMNPEFCKENYWINVVRDGSDKGNYPSYDDGNKDPHGDQSTLSNLDITFDDKGHTMFIKGDLEEGYKAFIHYCIVNDGTIPIKYVQSESKKDQHEEPKMRDDLKVQVDQSSEILEPKEKQYSGDSNGNPKLDIQVPHLLKDKDSYNEPSQDVTDKRSFKIQLPFVQWTLNKFSYGGNEDEN